MDEKDRQRLANLEVAVLAILADMTGERIELKLVARELHGFGTELGGFQQTCLKGGGTTGHSAGRLR